MKISDLKVAVVQRRLLAFAEGAVAQNNGRKLGLILDAEGEETLKPFFKLKEDLDLRQQDVRVVICGKRAAKNGLFEYPVISLEDFGWSGKISEVASDFLNSHYDVLISFTASENKTADFLVSLTRARLKVGRKLMGKNDIFDLTISAELSEPEVFTAELKKYLKIVNATIE